MALCRLDSLPFFQAVLELTTSTYAQARQAIRHKEPFFEIADSIRHAEVALRAVEHRLVLPEEVYACTLLHQVRYALLETRDLCNQYEDPASTGPVVFAEVYDTQLRHALGVLNILITALQDWVAAENVTIASKVECLEQRAASRSMVDYAKQFPIPDKVKSLRKELKDNVIEGSDSVHARASCGQWRKLDQMLLTDPLEINRSGKYYTLLHAAIMWQDCFAVAMLLAHGADLTAATRGPALFPAGTTPLSLAISIGNLATIRLLLAWGAPTMPACHAPTNSACHALLKDAGSVVRHVQEVCGFAYQGKLGQMLRILSEQHLPLNVKPHRDSRFFLVHQVAFWGNLDAFHLLLEGGASSLLRSTDQQLPSAVAASRSGGHSAAAGAMEILQTREAFLHPDPVGQVFSPAVSPRPGPAPTSPARHRIAGDEDTSAYQFPPRSPNRSPAQSPAHSPARQSTPSRIIRPLQDAFEKAKQKIHRSPSPTPNSPC